MLNAAIVGLGWWGRHIVRSMKGSERLRFVRLAASNPDRHRDFVEETGIKLLSGFDAVLDDPDVNAVILCTPHSQHERQVLKALAVGKQVFCEKPLALTRESAERMVSAAAKAGRILGIGHERRFEPAMEEIARLIKDGEIGAPMHAEANFSHDLLAGLDANSWRASPTEGPSLCMTGMGVHLTDLFISMLGPVVAVCATRADRVLGLPTGDVVAVALRFGSGATGFVSAIAATPYYGRFTLFGDQMWAEARDSGHPQHGGETLLTLCRKGAQQQMRKLPPFDPVRANLEEWAAAVGGLGRYRLTHAETINNTAVLEAVGLSAERGEWVKV
ncbi:MAG: Gfo/Idh/MocA family oxidoreductase [Gammaproteobacteria bacterium]|nr:Gfo/Idh/MocA family oxidoreductase [Gammaproteobacteria bacterium]